MWTADRRVVDAWRHLESTREIIKASDGLSLPKADRKALAEMETRAKDRLQDAIHILLAKSDSKRG